ncbi:MAG: hypothetical protein HZC40_08505 [Chloroflexi bacterium]|nr:hypothetical protein [Chloroflexota bacterium]
MPVFQYKFETKVGTQTGDVVLFHAYWQEGYFLSHYAGARLTYGGLEKPGDLQNAIASARNVWAIVQAIDHHPAEDWLAQNAFSLGESKYGQMRVLAYRAGSPARGEDFAEPITFNNGMELRGYRVNDTPIESGRGFATLQLEWGAPQTIARDYTISARLANSRGDVIWAHADHQPASGTRPTSTWQAGQTLRDHHALAIPPGTPPGDYVAHIVVYDSQTGDAANVIAPENRRAQTVMLGNVTVRASDQANVPAIPNPFDFQWNEIALVGFARGADAITPGDALPLTLYWRARAKPARDYTATIQLVDSSGAVRASRQHRPTSDAFPTSRWNAGETWLDKIILNVDAEAMNGAATIRVAMDARAVELTRVQINARAHRFDLPSPQFSKSFTLGTAITLLGYDLDGDAIKARATIPLTLYWQAREKIGERYTVFAHLLDAQGNLVAQYDREPDAGNAPTTSWLKDEVIVDRIAIELPANLAPGEYTLIVGMYHAPTGARLIANETNSDHIMLTKIRAPAR